MGDPSASLLGELMDGRRLRRRALIVLAAATLAGCATRLVETPLAAGPREALTAEMLSAIRAQGRDGDWLVMRGYHATDDLVAALTNTPFSHAAVLDAAKGQAIEAEGRDGVHASPIAQFAAKAHRLVLIRPVWSTPASAAAAVARARSLVGSRYDFPGLVGLSVPDTYYCSELALEVYRPFIRPDDVIPRPVAPAQLYYWGRVIFDSGAP
jgi:hypothetical protein